MAKSKGGKKTAIPTVPADDFDADAWKRDYDRRERDRYERHASQHGRDWGADGELAFEREAAVREALAASDPSIAKALDKSPLAVRSSYTTQFEPDWRSVIVFTEYAIGDPFEYPHVHRAFDRAVEVLNRDWPTAGFEWGWESIRAGVALFFQRRAAGNLRPARRNPTAAATTAYPKVRDLVPAATTVRPNTSQAHRPRSNPWKRGAFLDRPLPVVFKEMIDLVATDDEADNLVAMDIVQELGMDWVELSNMLIGMSEGLWQNSYLDWIERQVEDDEVDNEEDDEVDNEEDDEVDNEEAESLRGSITDPPESALACARWLLVAMVEVNEKTPIELFDEALEADRVSKRRIKSGMASRGRLLRAFGDRYAMQALGHGVSWFDDHADFPLKFPFHLEAHTFDGEELEWSGRTLPAR